MINASKGSVRRPISIDLPVNWLSNGMMSKVAITAMIIEKTESKIVSPINWKMSCLRSAPITFLTPISLALLKDLAVARLIKLKQAITRTKMAITVKAFT